MNTAGSTTETANREVLMHHQARLYQFKYWFGGKNLLAVFGKLRQVVREAPSSFLGLHLPTTECGAGFLETLKASVGFLGF